MPTNKLSGALSGRYKLVAHKADGTSRVVADWFDNLILNAGLERLGTGGVVGTCVVGSDSTPPAVGQSSLFALVASTTTQQLLVTGTAPDNSYAFYRKTFRFAIGVAAGNLSEVGVGWTNTDLFSRALIRDDLGDPTTITILADEVLDVIYEVRLYVPTSDQTFVVNIAGVDYTFTLRPGMVSGSGGPYYSGHWHNDLRTFLEDGHVLTGPSVTGKVFFAYGNGATMNAVTGSLSGSVLTNELSASLKTEFLSAYVPGSYERGMRMTFDLNDGNAAFGGFMLYTMTGTYQCVVSPNIPKDNTKILKIDFTVSWARKV